MSRKGAVPMSFDGKGGAVVTDLLIEGRSCKDWLAAGK